MSYPHDFTFPSPATQWQQAYNGLSKREYAAIHILAAMMSADSGLALEARVTLALATTDRLLEAL